MSRIRSALLATLLAVRSVDGQQPPDSLGGPVRRQPPGDSILAGGAASGWQRWARGFDVGTLDAGRDELNRAPSLPVALQARLPGVSVSQGQGFVGSSSRVWLRGPASFSVNEPLLIIDGARTHATQPHRGFEDRPLPSRLEDIDPDIIERVEVLRGAAAAAIYGPGASRGVILVTTKRGEPGPARWTAFAETGPMFEVTEFPANIWTPGVSTATGFAVPDCPLRDQGAGTCLPTARQSWNPLEGASPFRTGWNTGAGLGVSGGTSELTYRVSAIHDGAAGVYRNDEGRATNAHLDLGVAASPAIDVRFAGAYRSERLRHPTTDYIALGMLGAAVDDPERRGYGGPFSLGELMEVGRRDGDGRRISASLDAVWRPRPGLRASALVGYDELRLGDVLRVRGPNFPGSTDSTTRIVRNRDRPAARTAALRIERMYEYRGATARTAIGAEYIRDDDRGSMWEVIYEDDPGSPGFEARSSLDLRRSSYGILVQQHLGWDRLALTASMRADMAKGPFGTEYAPSVDASWIALRSERRRSRWLGDLRFRAAYARGGAHLIQSAEADDSFFGIGPSDEMAERASELEVGADASLLGDRVAWSGTAYQATHDQALIREPRPGGTGGEMISNDGRIVTRGVETMIDARVVETASLLWDLGFMLGVHRSDVRSPRGRGWFVEDFPQVIQSGESIGEYHTPMYTFADVNGDGLIDADEVTAVSEGFPSSGSPFPKYEASLRTGATIGRTVRVAAVLDRRSGQRLYAYTRRARCGLSPNCVEQHDPATPLAEQAAGVTARVGSPWRWIDDAAFTKLREVSLVLSLPRTWTGTASGRVTLTGRNLATWTSYRGLDPEIINNDPNGIGAIGGFFQPPLRSFSARLDLSW